MFKKKKKEKETFHCAYCDRELSDEERDETVRQDWEEIEEIRAAVMQHPILAVIEHHDQMQVAKALMLVGVQFIYCAFDGNIALGKEFLNKLLPNWWECADYEMPPVIEAMKRAREEEVKNDLSLNN